MAQLILPKRWGWQKPAPGAVIDRGHPLAPGLASAVLFAEGGGQTFYDDALGNAVLMQGNAWGQAPAPLWSSAALVRGAIVNGGGSNTGVSLGLPNALANAINTLTVVVGLNMSSTDATGGAANNPVIAAWDLASGNRPWTIDVHGGGDLRWFAAGGSAIASGGYTGGVQTIVAVTYNSVSGLLALYRDGVQKATGSGSGSILQNLSANVTLGYRVFSGNVGAWTGPLGFAYMWNRELKPADIMALQVDPFGFYAPQSPRSRVLVPAVAAHNSGFFAVLGP